jgi:hypothetical protein
MGIGSHDDWQVQLDGSLDLLLLALRDIATDSLCCALHRFGGHFQAGQDLHLCAAMIEGGLLTNQSLHAAYARRELRALNIQFEIGWELAGMTMRAQIVGTRNLHLTHGRQHRLGPSFAIMSLLAARAGKSALFVGRAWEAQQFGQRGCARAMHRRAHRHFDSLQVEPPRVAPATENDTQQLIYFVRDFLADRLRRFFSGPFVARPRSAASGRSPHWCPRTHA